MFGIFTGLLYTLSPHAYKASMVPVGSLFSPTLHVCILNIFSKCIYFCVCVGGGNMGRYGGVGIFDYFGNHESNMNVQHKMNK